MKIGELARATKLNIETIRYYERAKLLPAPRRKPNGHRAYGPDDVERLVFIRHCRALDMPLADVRMLLDFMARPVRDCSQVTRAVDAQLGRVRARLKCLQALEKQLAALRAECTYSKDRPECGILHQLVAAAHAQVCACLASGKRQE